MATDLRISELPLGGAVQPGDEIPINRGGINFKLTADNLASSGTFLADDGTVAAPSFAFTSEPGLGMYRAAAGVLAFASLGVERMRISTAGIQISVPFASPILAPNGTAAAPGHAFSGDSASGLYLLAAGSVGLSAGGTRRLSASANVFFNAPFAQIGSGGQFAWSSNALPDGAGADVGLARRTAGVLRISNGAAGQGIIVTGDGNLTTPGISFESATNTGMYKGTANLLCFTQAGTFAGYMYTQGWRIPSTSQFGFLSGTTDAAGVDTGLSRSAAGVVGITNGGATTTIFLDSTNTAIKLGTTSPGDVGMVRNAAGVLKISDGGSGFGRLILDGNGAPATPGIAFGAAGAIMYATPSPEVYIGTTATGYAKWAATNMQLPQTGSLTWSSVSVYASGPDTGIKRANVGILDVTNGSTGMGTINAARLDGWSAQGLSGNHFFRADTGGVALDSSRQFGWTSAANNAAAPLDTGLARNSAGVLRVTNGSTGAGALASKQFVYANTTTLALDANSSNYLLTNTGDADGSILNLPNDPSAGTVYDVAVTVAQTITINAGAGETIRDGATSGTVISSNVVGSTLRLAAVTAGAGAVWMVMSKQGTWTVS